MNRNIFIGGGVILALVLSVLALTTQPTKTIVERVIGSASSPSINGGCQDIDGVVNCFYSSGLRPASSTSVTAGVMCSFKVNATSTLTAATLKINANEAYENTFQIGYATDRYSTTTILASGTIAASVPGEVVATTTLTASGLTNGLLTPGRYINFKVSSGTPQTTFNPSGKCVVQLRQL